MVEAGTSRTSEHTKIGMSIVPIVDGSQALSYSYFYIETFEPSRGPETRCSHPSYPILKMKEEGA